VSEPKFTGIWIPAIVLTYPISITAKVCFGVVDGLDNEDGCFASNAYLQNHLQLEKRQLQNILKELGLSNSIKAELREDIKFVRRIGERKDEQEARSLKVSA